MSRTSLFPSVLLLLCVTVSRASGQQQPAQPTPEQQMISRLRYQWQALLLASVANARSHGQNRAEFGASLGKLFAPSWAKDLTPQGLARGMRSNVRLVGLEAELLEDTPEQSVVRFSRPDSAQFYTSYGSQGATLADWDETMKAVVEKIAAEHGLVWDQRPDGAFMVAKVTRKR